MTSLDLARSYLKKAAVRLDMLVMQHEKKPTLENYHAKI